MKKLFRDIRRKVWPPEDNWSSYEWNPWDMGSYEPPPKPEPWISAGGVVLNSMLDPKHIYVIKPSNNYGPWSFPKGRIDEGESQKQAAIREVWEETGLRAKILPQAYLGKGRGTMSITHYYMMVRTGGRPSRTPETEETRLVTFDEARRLFKRSGNRRDVRIANLAEAWLAKRVR